MNERATEIYAYMRAMMGVFSAMNTEERAELKKWEKENLDGNGISTSDWPGWKRYIGSKPTFDDRATDRSGFVYLIRCGETNRYKIGISKNVLGRVETLQTGNPEKLHVVCYFPAIDAQAKEQELHKHYEEKQVMREWFELTEKDVDYFLFAAETRCQ